MPLSFWEGAGHRTGRGKWWVRALLENSLQDASNVIEYGRPIAGKGGLHKLHYAPAQSEKKGSASGQTEYQANFGYSDAISSSRRN